MKVWRTCPGSGSQPAGTGAWASAASPRGGASVQSVEGNFHHAAEKSAFRAPAEQHRPVRPHRPERRAVARGPRRLRGAPGQPFRDAGAECRAIAGQRAAPAIRQPGRADGRAEIHRRLGIVARPPVGRELAGKPAENGFRGGKRLLDREETRHDPFHVAVHGGRGAVERDRGDRGGGIGADAGKRAQSFLALGKPAAMLRDQHPCAFVEVAGPGVVAEPLPLVQHVIELRFGESRERGPSGDEPPEIPVDGRHGGLLKHDFADPDPIRVRRRAGRRSPGQVAPVAVVPGEQFPGPAFRGSGVGHASHVLSRGVVSLFRGDAQPTMRGPSRGRARRVSEPAEERRSSPCPRPWAA